MKKTRVRMSKEDKNDEARFMAERKGDREIIYDIDHPLYISSKIKIIRISRYYERSGYEYDNHCSSQIKLEFMRKPKEVFESSIIINYPYYLGDLELDLMKCKTFEDIEDMCFEL